MKYFIPSIVVLSALAISPLSYGDSADDPVMRKVIESKVVQEPNNHAVRVIAGFHYFDAGDFAKAEEHFSKCSELTPEDPYDRAWLYMAQLRQNAKAPDATLKDFLKVKGSGDFIYTDIRLLIGEITPEAAIRLADASGDLGNVCDAHYYAAQRFLASGDRIKAKSHLEEALKTKKTTFWEYKSAVACLKKLDDAPATSQTK